MQARVDDARLDLLRRIWRPFCADDEQAHVAALLPHLIAVGTSVAAPPVRAEQLQRVYEELLPLLPEPPAVGPDGGGRDGAPPGARD